MNNHFSSFFQILVSLFSLSYLQCKMCPSITTNYRQRTNFNYAIRSFFQIPFTNILIVNSILKDTENSSIVYYQDISTKNGDTINVVQPEYFIIQMNYIYSQGKILAMNYDRLVIANTYTLKSEGVLLIPQLVDAQMIGKTDYAVATLKSNVMHIIDINLLQIVKTLDNSEFPNVLNTYSFYTKIFQLLSLRKSQYIIITVNSYGFFSWTIDLFDFNATYNDYIPQTIVKNTNYANRQFVKHPTQDLFFIGGLELIAFEIVNITAKIYRTQIKMNLINSTHTLNITNIVFKNTSNIASLNNPPNLVILDTYIYTFYLKYNNTSKQYSLPQSTPIYSLIEYPTYYTWFEMNSGEQDFRMILNAGYIFSIYDTFNRQRSYQLYLGSDFFSRRFLYEGKENFYAFPRNRSIQYFSKDYLGAQISFNDNMTSYPYYEENSFYITKNCQECLFIKTYDPLTTYSHFMNIIMLYPRQNYLNKTLNITSLGFKWNQVNLNLDPFYYKNQTWVVFGFRNKPDDKNFLFTLISMYDTTKNVRLTGATDEENSRKSSYALASFDDPDNLEIIGVDLIGYIYVWDFLSPQVIKYSRKTNCLNSDIGVLYQQNKKKWIIFACDNRYVLSYDFQKNETQFVSSVTKNPQSIKAYPRIGIIAIGDTITGNVYIHKFVNDTFTYFLTIQPGVLKDNMISFELLKDNTIWVQYSFSNMLYSLGDCLDDVKNCLRCEQNYNFNTNLKFNSATNYGNGTTSFPYTSAFNFLTAMLMAQRYQERISGVKSMNVNIFVDPQNIINIPQGFLNFDFSSIIQLSIQSNIQNQLATLEYNDKLVFSNYNYINLQDIKIQFILSKSPNECGINFINIYSNVTLNNIQLQTKSQPNIPLNCLQIHVNQTNIQILKLSIQDQDFSNHKSIFSTLYADWIVIKNLSLNNCTLGDNFSIVTQNSNLIVTIQSVSITNNKCTQERTKEVSSLFSSGLFTVEDLLIQNNIFCNKIIFSSVPSLQQQNYKFQFKQIQLLNNQFITKTSYIFFNSLYSMKQEPSHSVTFLQMSIQNNSLQKISDGDLIIASLIQTNKVFSHIFEDITFKNHHEISFSQIEYSSLVQIDKFYCINDKGFLDSSPNTDSGSCFQLNEISSTKISKIQINYKKAYNNELISIQNKLFYNHYDFEIIDGEFSNMMLMQYTINSFANPITILSQNSLTLNIINCHFFNNNLDITETAQTFSTSALWVENLLGKVNILESTFKNSTSSSIYNFMFIQSNSLELQNLTFNSSSFGLDSTKQLGGFMNLIINTLKIVDSTFSKSRSQYGSFIYIQTYGDLLNANITNCSFSEGYAEVDGGALYIDIKKSNLMLTCTNCFFDNIYTYSLGASTVGFQKYRITSVNHDHEMTFQGGHIQSIFGVGDNFFTDIFNMKLSLIDIKEIKPLIIYSEEQETSINKQFGQIASQQSALVSSQYSEINIKSCNIQDFQIRNQQTNLPLLINSKYTSVSIIDTTIQDGIFINSAIKVTNGTLTLEKSQFTNFVQQKILNQRQLFDTDENQQDRISSLIIIENSDLKIEQKTLFLGIKCYNNCTGAVFYLRNSKLDISDMVISDSEAEFGGSLFIQGLKQFNQIVSSKFYNNIAQIDGGAIYLQALIEDSFQLKIQNCSILSNNAITGKGGALFIRSNSKNSTNQLIEIQDTQLIANIAGIGGGMYQKEISPKILGSTIFQQNVGKTFGNDTLSYPTHLRLTSMDKFLSQYEAKIDENDAIVVSNFRSGDTLKNLSFELLNDQDEIIRPITAQELQDFVVKVQVGVNQNFQNYSIRGDVSTSYDSIQSQQFVFKDFDFIGIPGSTATLEFLSDQIYVLDINKVNQYNHNYSFKIIVKFRNCTQGEAISTYGSLTECIVCQEGKFSFDLQKCQACPTGATCSGINLIANQGYWRNSNESSILISCSLLENCEGGSFGNHICYEGHIGALCEECDIFGIYWNKSYTRSAKYSCTKCNEIVYNIWLVVLVTIWTLIAMTLAIKGDIQAKLELGTLNSINFRNLFRQKLNSSQKSQINSQNYFKSAKSVITNQQTYMESSSISYCDEMPKNLQRSRNQNNLSIYIKILINYLQIISSVTTLNLNIPEGILRLLSFFGQPLNHILNLFDCFLKDYEISIPFIYFRQMISFLIPLGFFLIFLLGLGCLNITNINNRFPSYFLSTAAIFLFIYFQPSLVSQLIALVSCRQIGDTNYILSNVSYICYTSEHLKYVLLFLIPALTIWVLVLPLLLFSMLYKNRNNLKKIKIKMIYGFLYKEYKQKVFYWEFVKMAEIIFIILSLNFYSTIIHVKSFLAFAIILIYGLLSIIIKPFEEQKVNSLDNYSTIVCGLTVLLGFFIHQNPFPYFYFSSLGIMAIINLLFIYVILKKIINVQMNKCKKLYQNILKKLALIFPQVRNYLKSKEGKQINPLVKEKIKKIFSNYLSLSDEEKQKMRIRLLKSSFKYTLQSMFRDYDDIDNDDVDNDINLRSVQYQYANNIPDDQKFNHLNHIQEQNNLLTKKHCMSIFSPFFTQQENVNDDEKYQQKSPLFRLSILSQFNQDDKCTEKPLKSEQSEVNTEEFQGDCSSSSKYLPKKFSIFNSLNNQKTNEELIQTRGELNNHYVSLNNPMTFYQDEIKTNHDENGDSQQKRVMARPSVLDHFKTDEENTPNTYLSQEIEFQYFLDDKLAYQGDMQVSIKEQRSQIEDIQIEAEQDTESKEDIFQINLYNDNLQQFLPDHNFESKKEDFFQNIQKNL